MKFARASFLGAIVPLVVVASSTFAFAGTPPPITKNDYSLEFYQGPLIAPIRVTGFGGAYTAYAESVNGVSVNAAAPAVREPFSFDWFDYDFDLGISLPGSYGGSDFDNRGQDADKAIVDRVDGFLYANAGLLLQFGELGVAATAELLQYNLSQASAASNTGGMSTTTTTNTSTALKLNYTRYHVLASYGFDDNQLCIGGGVRAVGLQIRNAAATDITKSAAGLLPSSSGDNLLTMIGAGPEAGIVWKPNELKFRLGATVRAPVSGNPSGVDNSAVSASGVRSAGGFILPSRVVQPWEVEAGFALQLGARPFNPPWINAHTVDAHVRDKIDEARAARKEEHEARLARAPADQRKAVKAEIAREEEALRAIEDERMQAEHERLLAIRKARFENWPRERVLLLGSLLMTGKSSSDAVSFEGVLNQQREIVGQAVSFSPRLGIESEPVINWVRAQVGSYLEPSRFDYGHVREHFTFGADVKLAYFSPFHIFGEQVWMLTSAADIAPRWIEFYFGLGAWH